MHPAWARAAIDCAHADGTPVFFKQWGEWVPSTMAVAEAGGSRSRQAQDAAAGPCTMYRVGRKAAGKRLGGKAYFEWPVLRGEQRVAYTWVPPARYRRRLVTLPVDAPVWPTAYAARTAAPEGAPVLEFGLPKPYKRSVYARAEDETFQPEQDRLLVVAEL